MGTGTAVGTGDVIAASKMNLKLESVVNADIEAGAAILRSKIDLGSGLINADIAAAAAIARSKLNFDSGLVNADIAAAAAVARSKLDFGTGLVNTDIATAAAIARSKLNFGNGLVNADIAANAAIEISKMEGMNILMGILPFDISTPGTTTGTTHTTQKQDNGVALIDVTILNIPTPPTGYTLKGRLCVTLSSSALAYTASCELWNATDSTQITAASTANTTPTFLHSALFTVPDYGKELFLRTWSSFGTATAKISSAHIEFIAIKN